MIMDLFDSVKIAINNQVNDKRIDRIASHYPTSLLQHHQLFSSLNARRIRIWNNMTRLVKQKPGIKVIKSFVTNAIN